MNKISEEELSRLFKSAENAESIKRGSGAQDIKVIKQKKFKDEIATRRKKIKHPKPTAAKKFYWKTILIIGAIIVFGATLYLTLNYRALKNEFVWTWYNNILHKELPQETPSVTGQDSLKMARLNLIVPVSFTADPNTNLPGSGEAVSINLKSSSGRLNIANKMEKGDRIEINHLGQSFTYQIVDFKSDQSNLANITDPNKEILTLITPKITIIAELIKS